MDTFSMEMESLAKYIARSPGSDFDAIWEGWLKTNSPEKGHEVSLKKNGRQLCIIDKTEILNVPSAAYWERIGKIIDKGDDANGQGKHAA